MEKDIYITEAPCSPELYEAINGIKEKVSTLLYQTRPDVAPVAKRVWQNFPEESYYDDKSVKPGLSLYKLIIELQEKRLSGQYEGPTLKLNIPQTVILNDNTNIMIYTHNQTVKVEPFATNERFLAEINSRPRKQIIHPLVLNSSASGISFNDSVLMNTEVTTKIVPRSEGFVCRKFVHPYANNPNLLRFCYSISKQRKCSKRVAYKMINLKAMDQEMFKKKHRVINNFFVNSHNSSTYNITTITGKALSNFTAMTESFIEYLEKGACVKITDIVIDFIIDQEKTPWLHEVKSIKSSHYTNIWKIAGKPEMELLLQKNNNSHLCKLCGVSYTKNEMDKIVTNKLIWEFKNHLQSRGIPFQLFFHMKKEGLSYLCEFCYEVVVAEHELITIEKQFSGLLNISYEFNMHSKPQKLFVLDQEDFIRNGQQMPSFKAWRLFIYAEKIKNFVSQRDHHNKQTTIKVQMKFKKFREVFTKTINSHQNNHQNLTNTVLSRYSSNRVQSAKLEKRSVLSDKFNQSILSRRPYQSKMLTDHSKAVETATTLTSKITASLSKERSKENFSLEKVKIYQFYTKKHQSKHIFNKTTLQFSVSINDENLYGRSATLEQLKNKDTCQRHSSEIFLFDDKLNYCNLQITVGLICDGEVSGQDLGLQQYEGLFYGTHPNISYRPLPQEWIQVFTKGESIPSEAKQLTYDDIKGKRNMLLQKLQIS